MLTHDAAGYRLIAEPEAVDSLRFARLAAEAHALPAGGSAEQARARAEEALRPDLRTLTDVSDRSGS